MNKKLASFHTTENIIKRDISIQVITLFSETLLQERKNNQDTELNISNEIKMLDVNVSSGLRSLRYLKEIPLLSSITVNNPNIQNSELFMNNLERNNISKEKVNYLSVDPRIAMYSHIDISKQYDIIELDSYKSVSTYLDAAVQAITHGGLLCITNTDANVLKGYYPEICYSRYGSIPLPELYSDEQSIRILLHSLETAANRYGRYIHPWLCISNINTQRLYIRVYNSPAKVRKCLMNQVRVYQSSRCPSFVVQGLGRYKKGAMGLVATEGYSDTSSSGGSSDTSSGGSDNSSGSNSMREDSEMTELMTTFGSNNSISSTSSIDSSNSDTINSDSSTNSISSSISSDTTNTTDILDNTANTNTIQTIAPLPIVSYHSTPLHLEPSGETMFATATCDISSYCEESGGKWKIGGPYYGGSLYDTDIINSLLFKYKNIKYQLKQINKLKNNRNNIENIENITETINETEWNSQNSDIKNINSIILLLADINMELNDILFYYDIRKLAQTIQCSKVPKVLEIQSALVNAGYRVSGFQNNAFAIKTDASYTVVSVQYIYCMYRICGVCIVYSNIVCSICMC